jgi:hypothetical protein
MAEASRNETYRHELAVEELPTFLTSAPGGSYLSASPALSSRKVALATNAQEDRFIPEPVWNDAERQNSQPTRNRTHVVQPAVTLLTEVSRLKSE